MYIWRSNSNNQIEFLLDTFYWVTLLVKFDIYNIIIQTTSTRCRLRTTAQNKKEESMLTGSSTNIGKGFRWSGPFETRTKASLCLRSCWVFWVRSLRLHLRSSSRDFLFSSKTSTTDFGSESRLQLSTSDRYLLAECWWNKDHFTRCSLAQSEVLGSSYWFT